MCSLDAPSLGYLFVSNRYWRRVCSVCGSMTANRLSHLSRAHSFGSGLRVCFASSSLWCGCCLGYHFEMLATHLMWELPFGADWLNSHSLTDKESEACNLDFLYCKTDFCCWASMGATCCCCATSGICFYLLLNLVLHEMSFISQGHESACYMNWF